MATERAKARQVLEESGVSLQTFLDDRGLTNPVTVVDWLQCNTPATLYQGDKTAINNPVNDYGGVGIYLGTPDDGVLVVYVNSEYGGIHIRSRTLGVWTDKWFTLDNPNLTQAEDLMAQFNILIDNTTGYLEQAEITIGNYYDSIRSGEIGGTEVKTSSVDNITLSPSHCNAWTRVKGSYPKADVTITVPNIQDYSTWPEWPEAYFEVDSFEYVHIEEATGVTVKVAFGAYPALWGEGSVAALKLVDKVNQVWMLYGMLEEK